VEVSWHDDGAPSAAGYWKQDTIKRGRWKYYHRNGELKATEEYDDQGRITVCNCFDEKGAALDTALCREKEAKVDKQRWRRFMETSLQPLVEQKAKEGLAGSFTVAVRFVVDLDGRISDVKALTNYGYGIEEGVVAIFKNAPLWTPGSVHGKKVRSYHTQPVSFVIR
jgi:antitoxin component YwqK of YwqJK toxin-antitoxin module